MRNKGATKVGDLKVEVFCDTAPATSFNFLALCASGAAPAPYADRQTTADRAPPAAALERRYTVFGRLIDGFDALDALEKLPVGKKNRPTTDVRIERVTIHANPARAHASFFASPPAGAGE
ncbi:peptidyl-prolyl cis-trans isomerase [Aureococcus anophagefferens]|uniref:Peptidyl-prolyl cis-trans isomerase n=1 Tax=Aureococcus anophagefferens TaxID=44056 RepID=A0ABR1GA17_AURAN